MQFKFLTPILALLSVASAAPLVSRAVASFYPNLAVNIFTPDHGTVTGAVYVFRVTEQGIQHETNSLLSVPFPSGYAGKTCSFSFANGYAPPDLVDGLYTSSKRVQLFSVGGPISPSNTYTSRPYRNISYGIFLVSNDGKTGKWDGAVPTFPCPTSATTLGFEVVSEGDNDDVSWPLNSGLAVIVL